MTEEIPLEIGQVWRQKFGSMMEIVALGPKYVAYSHPANPDWGTGSCTKEKFRSNVVALIPPPKPKHTVWLNIYGLPYLHQTKAAADAEARDLTGRRIACIKVEFQEGDGL